MKPVHFACICLMLASTLAPAQNSSAIAPLSKTALNSHVVAQFGRLPLAFEPNRGQMDGSIEFLSHGLGPNIFFTAGKVAIGSEVKRSLSLTFPGSKGARRIDSLDPLPGKVNYLKGNDPSRWITQVPTFATVKYAGVYPGIDVRFHGKGGELEYDFDVAPGADPRKIRVRFDPDARLQVDPSGDLVIRRDGAEMREHPPRAYQLIHGLQKGIEARAVVRPGNEVGFVLAEYDRKRVLVIDPAIVYEARTATPQGIAVDSAGEVFLAGTAGTGFLSTPGAFQTMNAGAQDGFIMKSSSDGQTILYATFLGGSAIDIINGIAIDAAGNAYVVGSTQSTNFPVTPSAFQGVAKGGTCQGGAACSDAFVTVLTADGSALVYSTYLGSSGADSASAVAVDPSGAVYVTGVVGAVDFPTTPGVIQTTFNSGLPPFVSKIDPTKSGIASLVYSTFFGGNNFGFGNGIAVDSSGEAFVTGSTYSTTLATPGAFQTAHRTGSTGFVAKLNATASAFIFATYLGGPVNQELYCPDQGLAIAIDSSGDSFVTGVAGNPDFPTTPGAFQTVNKSHTSNAFVSKLNSTGSALLYSTLLGGSGFALFFGGCTADFGSSIFVDAAGNAYVTGQTTSQDFPTTATTIEPACSPGDCAFSTEVNPTGTDLILSTYLAGNYVSQGSYGTGVAVDSAGKIYVAGSGQPPLINAPPSLQTGTGFITKIDLAASAPAGGVFPTSLNFGTLATGSNSQLPLTLSSRGDLDLTITSIGISGGFFTQTNNCPTSLAPATSCTITVTFSPTTVGTFTGQVTVTDNAFDSPHVASLMGIAGTPVVVLSASSLTFGDQGLNSTSPSQPVKLSNFSAPLSVASIATTGDFAQSNNCGNMVAAGSSCTINVTFTPHTLGSESGTLTITDNAANSPQIVLLGGNGIPSLNLGVAPGTPNSATVTAGSTANYTLSIGGGGIGGTATLTCTGAPKDATCTVPASENVSATTVTTFAVNAKTMARTSASLAPHSSLGWFWATALLGLVVLPAATSRKRSLRRLGGMPILLLLFITSCGGGGSGSGGSGGGSTGTPAGTYTLTVTATMGSTTQSTALTLIVK